MVYGSLFGGLLAIGVFTWRQKVPLLAVGDLLVPGMLVGLALGRIGCLLNGCCWGGMCDDSVMGITFPLASPAVRRPFGERHTVGIATTATGMPERIWSRRLRRVAWASSRDFGPAIRSRQMLFPSGEELTAVRNSDPEARQVARHTHHQRRPANQLGISATAAAQPVRLPNSVVQFAQRRLLCCVLAGLLPAFVAATESSWRLA